MLIRTGQDVNEVLQNELQAKGINLNPQEIEEVGIPIIQLKVFRKS